MMETLRSEAVPNARYVKLFPEHTAAAEVFALIPFGRRVKLTAFLSSRAAEIRKTLDHALSQVNRLEALVANTVANDVTVMAAWKAARRIERASTKKSAEGVSPPVSQAVSTA